MNRSLGAITATCLLSACAADVRVGSSLQGRDPTPSSPARETAQIEQPETEPRLPVHFYAIWIATAPGLEGEPTPAWLPGIGDRVITVDGLPWDDNDSGDLLATLHFEPDAGPGLSQRSEWIGESRSGVVTSWSSVGAYEDGTRFRVFPITNPPAPFIAPDQLRDELVRSKTEVIYRFPDTSGDYSSRLFAMYRVRVISGPLLEELGINPDDAAAVRALVTGKPSEPADPGEAID